MTWSICSLRPFQRKLMAYTIDRITNSEVDATVLFMKEDGDDFWSLA